MIDKIRWNRNIGKRLSKSEEIAILRSIIEDGCYKLGNGSSRVTFPYGEDKVIKVAFSNEGRVQNYQELMATDDNPDIAAEIYGYGSNIIIAERVETDDFMDAFDTLSGMDDAWVNAECGDYYDDILSIDNLDEDDYNYIFTDYIEGEGRTVEEFEEALNVFNKANCYTGFTIDNGQIGWSYKRNKWVMYDFGFTCNEESPTRSIQVGSLNECYYYSDDYADMISDLIACLKNRRYNKHNYHSICPSSSRW